MDELLAKYIIGEATPAEMEVVARWIKDSAHNEHYFNQFKLIWETSGNIDTGSTLDVDASWTEFKQLRSSLPASAERMPLRGVGVNTRLYPKGNLMRIAAIWIAVIGIVVLLYTFMQPTREIQQLTLRSHDMVKSDTLSDGSVITLNKNSVLKYPGHFSGDTREVQLVSGEAFFSIAHNPSKPFLVHLNNAVVKVVGTSFNISNSKTAAEIIVETGIVEVIRKQVVVRLKPAEKAAINYGTGTVTKGVAEDKFYNYYRTKEFVANETPLWRVAEVLNKVYKVNIQIPNKALAERKLSTTLRLGALDPILKIIADTFNVQIVQEPGKIIIK